MKTLCQRENAPPIPSLDSTLDSFSLAFAVSGLVLSPFLFVRPHHAAHCLFVAFFCFIFIWIRFDALLLGDTSAVEGIISASSTRTRLSGATRGKAIFHRALKLQDLRCEYT